MDIADYFLKSAEINYIFHCKLIILIIITIKITIIIIIRASNHIQVSDYDTKIKNQSWLRPEYLSQRKHHYCLTPTVQISAQEKVYTNERKECTFSHTEGHLEGFKVALCITTEQRMCSGSPSDHWCSGHTPVSPALSRPCCRASAVGPHPWQPGAGRAGQSGSDS